MEINKNEGRVIGYKDFKILVTLTSLVAILMAFSTLTVQKSVPTFGGLTVPAASIWFALVTFPAMQIICNAYGKKYAHFAIFVGWVSMLLTTFMAQITVVMPASPAFEARSEVFNSLLRGSLRYFVAASFSYVSTHALGNEFFSRLKRVRKLWLKSTLTTVIAQIVNAVVFTFAMFVGTTSVPNLISMVAGTLIVRMCLVPIVTALVCFGSLVVDRLKKPAVENKHNLLDCAERRIGLVQRIFASFL